MAPGLEEEEQMCPERSEAATGCAGQGEPGGPETGPSGTDTGGATAWETASAASQVTRYLFVEFPLRTHGIQSVKLLSK